MKEEEKIDKIIKNLIEEKKEGTYWDYKENINLDSKLLHEILCLSNCKHDGDRYLIIGVRDPKKLNNENDEYIVGLNKQTLEKLSSENFYYWLSSKNYAGDNRPPADIKKISYENKELLIIIIKNSDKKPFFLTSEIKEKKNKNYVNPYIYTRVGDTNTPKNKTASYLDIKEMWKEHFHLDKKNKIIFLRLLKQKKEWIQSTDEITNEINYYNKNHPEYSIENPMKIEDIETELYSVFFKRISKGPIYYKKYNTVIEEGNMLYSNITNCDFHIPEPYFHEIKLNNINTRFYYYIKNDLNGCYMDLIYNEETFKYINKFPFLILANEEKLNMLLNYTKRIDKNEDLILKETCDNYVYNPTDKFSTEEIELFIKLSKFLEKMVS